MAVKLHLVCGVFLFAFLSWAHGQPVKDQELEEVLSKLQDLKRLNDGSTTKPNEGKVSAVAGLEQRTGQRTVAPSVVSGYKTKRSLNNSDRRTLLYNYYSRGLAPMYDKKRNFDEIDRFARFNGKRNLDYEPSYVTGDHGYNGRLSKRNFDEIDRYNGFNYRLNGDEVATIGKRNFDEIDRFGRFAFNKRYFPEVNELSAAGGGNSLKHDLSDDMAVINEYTQ